MFDLSATVTEYVPAFRSVTFFPSFFSVIVKPGPTVPVSFGNAACEGAAIASTPVSAASRMVMRKRFNVSPFRGKPGHCQDRGGMRVREVATGLWWWTALHPAWTPADGGPDGW